MINPKYCFYLLVFTLPFAAPFFIGSQELPINQTDLLIVFTSVIIFYKYITERSQISLKTPIDKWFVILFVIYLVTGLTSSAHNGYQGIFKYIELVLLFYSTVYLIRSKIISISDIIKSLIYVALFEASLGILQSLTGGFGASWIDNRGYLGYLGIGSTAVWHGQGTFTHFNMLAGLLCITVVFLIPLRHFLLKSNIKNNILFFILLFGVITTYSRNSLITIFLTSILFLFIIDKNKFYFFLKFVLSTIPLFLIYMFLKDTSYFSTLNPRDHIWAVNMMAFSQSIKTILIGNGLRAVDQEIFRFLPSNLSLVDASYFQAHSFYIYNLIEVGVIGTFTIIAFYIVNLINFLKGFNSSNKKYYKAMYLMAFLFISGIFIQGIFDLVFNRFNFQVLIYLILGIVYAKNHKLYGESRQ
ncbi:MAG: hypothetical protein WCK67_11700 [bacterium]